MEEKYRKKILSFARRIGKALRPNHRNLIENLLPKLKVEAEEFNSYREVNLEIGFGSGEHIFNKAINNPDILFIGAEPFLNGVAKLLAKIEEHDIKNIRIWDNDVNDLLTQLPENIFDKIYILFPDPWPKARHNKRRIIQTPFIKKIYQYMKPKGKLIIATDHDDYEQWIEDELAKCPEFKLNTSQNDFPNDWVKTKYQLKAEQENISSRYFEYTT